MSTPTEEKAPVTKAQMENFLTAYEKLGELAKNAPEGATITVDGYEPMELKNFYGLMQQYMITAYWGIASAIRDDSTLSPRLPDQNYANVNEFRSVKKPISNTQGSPPNTPDSCPNTPDSSPNTPDSSPNTPDSSPNTPGSCPNTPTSRLASLVGNELKIAKIKYLLFHHLIEISDIADTPANEMITPIEDLSKIEATGNLPKVTYTPTPQNAPIMTREQEDALAAKDDLLRLARNVQIARSGKQGSETRNNLLHASKELVTSYERLQENPGNNFLNYLPEEDRKIIQKQYDAAITVVDIDNHYRGFREDIARIDTDAENSKNYEFSLFHEERLQHAREFLDFHEKMIKRHGHEKYFASVLPPRNAEQYAEMLKQAQTIVEHKGKWPEKEPPAAENIDEVPLTEKMKKIISIITDPETLADGSPPWFQQGSDSLPQQGYGHIKAVPLLNNIRPPTSLG